MAVTKIKKIYATVVKAADYITDIQKTGVGMAAEYITDSLKVENGALVEYYNCGNTPLEAAHCFDATRQRGSNRSTVLANHIIS